MGALSQMPNIGDVLEHKLIQAGIAAPKQLLDAGSQEAFRRIRLHSDPTACLSTLYALQGAVEGIRWHDLAPETKASLKQFHQSL